MPVPMFTVAPLSVPSVTLPVALSVVNAPVLGTRLPIGVPLMEPPVIATPLLLKSFAVKVPLNALAPATASGPAMLVEEFALPIVVDALPVVLMVVGPTRIDVPVTARPLAVRVFAVMPPFAVKSPVNMLVVCTSSEFNLARPVELSVVVSIPPFAVILPAKVIGSVMPANKAEGLTCDSVPSAFATTIRSLVPSVVAATPPIDNTPNRPSA
ncbi:MAG: hypothetical protein EBR51_10315 [Gammaproteobacteria bacterium]|nr:hypothetical protein [Gammaproteobacteria bacterium]